MLKEYLEDIAKTFKSGHATEASYYFALKKLIENYLISKNKESLITIEERKTKAGKPDFTIRKGKELVGHIEAKDITVGNLSDVYDTEQIERYQSQLPNFILTNFLDFQLFRKGKKEKSELLNLQF